MKMQYDIPSKISHYFGFLRSSRKIHKSGVNILMNVACYVIIRLFFFLNQKEKLYKSHCTQKKEK